MKRVLGIDLGGEKTKLGLVYDSGEIPKTKEFLTNRDAQPEEWLERIYQIITEELDQKVDLIGLGVPGPINLSTRSMVNPPNFPLWQQFPIADSLERILKKRVFIDRDAHCAAIGENWLGEFRGARNAVLLTWGTGIGSSLVIDGKIYYGQKGLGGELGHMIIDPKGPECPFGHQGCLESFIGGGVIEKKHEKPLAWICQDARKGEKKDLEIIEGIRDHLTVGLDNIMTIFDPEKIVIAGGVSRSLDLILPEMKNYPLSIASLGMGAGFIGAARMAMLKEKNQFNN